MTLARDILHFQRVPYKGSVIQITHKSVEYKMYTVNTPNIAPFVEPAVILIHFANCSAIFLFLFSTDNPFQVSDVHGFWDKINSHSMLTKITDLKCSCFSNMQFFRELVWYLGWFGCLGRHFYCPGYTYKTCIVCTKNLKASLNGAENSWKKNMLLQARGGGCMPQ